MSLSLNEHRVKLINKILLAHSQEEVKRLVNTAIKSLGEQPLNGRTIFHFADKTSCALDLLNPLNKDAQQWSNISMAKILLNRIQLQYEKVAN